MSRVFPGSLRGVSRKFLGTFKVCFKKVSRMLQRSCRGVYRKFQGGFREIPWAFQNSLLEVLRKIEGWLKVVLSGFQGHWKESQRVCQKGFNGVSRVF